MNAQYVVLNNLSAKFFAVVTIVSMLLSAFPVAFFVAEAASSVYSDTPGGQASGSTEFATPNINTTNFTNLTLSFDFDASGGVDSADGLEPDDTFAYGWRIGSAGTKNQLGSLSGVTGTDSTEVGTISNVSVPAGVEGVINAQFYFEVISAAGTDIVEITNISISGTAVPAPLTGPTDDVYNVTTDTSYPTLEAAVAAAAPNDEIRLEDNVLVESEVVINEPLTIDGNGYQITTTVTFVSTGGENSVLEIVSDDVTLLDIDLDGSGGTDLHGINIFESNNIVISDAVITNNDRTAINVNSSEVTINDITTAGNSIDRFFGVIDAAIGSQSTAKSSLTINGTSVHNENPLVTPISLPPATGVTVHVYFPVAANVDFTDTEGQYQLLSDPLLPSGSESRVLKPKEELEPETGNLRVCKLLVDRNGNLTDGDSLSGDFSVDITGPNGFSKTVTFSPTLDLDTDLVSDNGEADDAECVIFGDVAVGTYEYSTESITSEYSWETPLYHDFFSKTPDSLGDFGEFTVDGSDDDNDDTDGVLNLGKNKTRTLAIVNTQTPVCAIGENLLTNGSFEEPVVTNNSLWQKFSSVAGWVIEKVSDNTPTTLEIHRGWEGNTAADGWQYAELDGDESTLVSQTIDTVPGATYELKWAFAPRHNLDSDENQLTVMINDGVVASEGPAVLPAGLAPSDWIRTSYPFVATSNETTITFADAGANSDSFGTFLDDAAVCFVREPLEEEPDSCSFAGSVVSATQGLTNGGDSIDGDRSDVSAVEAGKASYTNFFGKEGNDWQVNPLDFYSLGINGELVYEFTNKIAVDGPGHDIAIWEITGGNPLQQTQERADVYGSEDGLNFVLLGQAVGDTTFDIAGSGLSFVKYVKLIDQSNGVQGNNGDGFDLDAITIIDESCSDYTTISASKIVCDYEEELPNWGKRNNEAPNMITAATAAAWLADQGEDTTCRMVEDWQFQWSDKSVKSPSGYNTFLGEAPGWNTFSGTTVVPMTVLDGGNLEFREVLPETDEYITFSGGNDSKPSAELYCGNDVLNYDNLERVNKPQANETYHCVAWNVPKERPLEQCTIVSDTMTVIEETNMLAVETYDRNNNWTASIPGATWIWDTYLVTDPTADQTNTFVETFTVDDKDAVEEAILTVAADNGYKVTLNGFEIEDRSDQETNFRSHTVKDFDIAGNLVTGENRLEIEVTNFSGNSNPRRNPAGALYKLTITAQTACERTTAVEDDEPPVVTVLLPVDGFATSSDFDIVVQATDDTGVQQLVLNLYDTNGDFMAPCLNSDGGALLNFTDTCSVDVSGLATGTYSFKTNARDTSDNLSNTVTQTFVILEDTTENDNGSDTPSDGGDDNLGDDNSQLIQTFSSNPVQATRVAQPRRQETLESSVLGLADSRCPVITDFMQMGVENDELEVKKLQSFLDIFAGMYGGTANPVTGTFGSITDANVKALQAHFSSEILDPWVEEGVVQSTRPTGFVYKTTLWKINDLVCGAEFPSLEGETLENNVDLEVPAIRD